ncbi:Hypothetical predicted protein [Olea europaea subsp. europaea]|uniref:Uncharacterized protein n=1 Tax=Olea europaea subsp. europaea TaxID=158383 RepID=A0A8S0P847_OLEEU|nr:Hypothetical predicted protein [Olea europaea subsp. europaea]
MVRKSIPKEMVSPQEPELPRAGVRAISLAAIPALGAPTTELGGNGNGERAAMRNFLHRDIGGSVLSTVLRAEQQVPSGIFVVLPVVTKDRQSAMLSTKLEQSTAGAGDAEEAGVKKVAQEQSMKMQKIGNLKNNATVEWSVVLEKVKV